HLPRQRSAPNTTAAARTPMPTYTSDVLIVMSISPTARPSSTITRLMTGRGPRLAPLVRRREGELRGVGALLPVSGSGVSAGGSALFDCPPPADPPPGGPPPGGPPPGGPPPGGWFPPGGPAGGLPWPGSRRGSCGRCGPDGRCGGACDGPCCRCGPGGAVRLGGGPLGPLGLAGAPWPGGGPAGLFGAGRPPGCAPSGRGGVLTDIRELFPSFGARRPNGRY